MSYNDDEWFNTYNLNELTKPKSPQPGGYYESSLDNIPLDEFGSSPGRDLANLDYGGSDLTVPLEDFTFANDPLPLSPNASSSGLSNMHVMQNASSFDSHLQSSAGSNVDYNTFEQPTVVPSMDLDPFGELAELDQNTAFYASQQPSTSEQQVVINSDQTMQIITSADNSGQYGQQQHTLIQMQPSTSYMPQMDQMQNGQIVVNDRIVMSQNQQQGQQMQSQSIQQQNQPPAKPAPAKKAKANNRKKQPANTVGAVLTKVNKLSQPVPDQGGSRMETRMTAEDSERIGQLLNEIARLKEEQQNQGTDHSAVLNQLQTEFSSIFAKNLQHSSSVNTEIITQIQSLTGGSQSNQPSTISAPPQPPPQQQQQQQIPPPTVAPKRAPPKRSRNTQQKQTGNAQATKIGPPKMDPPTTTVVVVSSNSQYISNSPSFHGQIVYQTAPLGNQNEVLQSMPSTSTAQAQYIDYSPQQPGSQGNGEIILQNQAASSIVKIPSINSRTHVFRQQAVVYPAGSPSPSQSLNAPTTIAYSQQQIKQIELTQSPQPEQIPATLGDVLRQHQQQLLRFQQEQVDLLSTAGTSTPIRAQLIHSAPSSSKAGTNRRRMSLQQQKQPDSPLIVASDSITPTPPQDIDIDSANEHLFPEGLNGAELLVAENKDAIPDGQEMNRPHSLTPQPTTPLSQGFNQSYGSDPESSMPLTPYDESIQDSPILNEQFPLDMEEQFQTEEDIEYSDELEEEEEEEEEKEDEEEELEYDLDEDPIEQLEEFAEQKRLEREQKIQDFMLGQLERVENPDTVTPFQSMKNVVERLLPYHLFHEPDVVQEAFDDFDDNWYRHNINIQADIRKMGEAIQRVCLKETYKNSDKVEVNLLKYLDTEYERKRIENDRAHAEQDLESFVESSNIIRLFRNGELDDKLVNNTSIKPEFEVPEHEEVLDLLYQEYEFHDFDENPRPVSPYSSPILSPTFSTSSSNMSRFNSRSRLNSSSIFSPVTPSLFSPESLQSLRSTSIPDISSPLPISVFEPPPVLEQPVVALEPVVVENKIEKVEMEIELEKKNEVEQVEKDTKVVQILKEEVEMAVEEPETTKIETCAAIRTSESGTQRLPSKKAFLTRARKDVPASLRSPQAQSTPVRDRLLSTSSIKGSLTPVFVESRTNASSTAETYDSEGSASPELGMEDMEVNFYQTPKTQINEELMMKENDRPTAPTLDKVDVSTPMPSLSPVPPTLINETPKALPPLPKLRVPIATLKSLTKSVQIKQEVDEDIHQPIKLRIKLNPMRNDQESVEAPVVDIKPVVMKTDANVKKDSEVKGVKIARKDSLKRKSVETVSDSIKNKEKEEEERPVLKKKMRKSIGETKNVETKSVEKKIDQKKTPEKRVNDVKKPEIRSAEKKTPEKKNGLLEDRFLRVMTDDVSGRIRLRFRRDYQSFVPSTPKSLANDDKKPNPLLTPTAKTRLTMKIRRSTGECSIDIREEAKKIKSKPSSFPSKVKTQIKAVPQEKPSIPVVVKSDKSFQKATPTTTNGPAYVKMSDKSKVKMMERLKRKKTEQDLLQSVTSSGTTTPATTSVTNTKNSTPKQKAFSNKFNPFAMVSSTPITSSSPSQVQTPTQTTTQKKPSEVKNHKTLIKTPIQNGFHPTPLITNPVSTTNATKTPRLSFFTSIGSSSSAFTEVSSTNTKSSIIPAEVQPPPVTTPSKSSPFFMKPVLNSAAQLPIPTTPNQQRPTPSSTVVKVGSSGSKRKISALLPWISDEALEKKAERKTSIKTEEKETPKPEKKVEQRQETPIKLEPPSSPRASSSLSLTSLFDDEKSNGVYTFLRSPPRESEPLPAVDFSDDDDDSEAQHKNLTQVTDRIIAMSSSQANSTAPLP